MGKLLSIDEMDSLGVKRTKEFLSKKLKAYSTELGYRIEYIPLPTKGKRVDVIAKLFFNDEVIKIYIIETKIRNNTLEDFTTGSFKSGLLIEKAKYDLIRQMAAYGKYKYPTAVVFGIYLNFLKNATLVFNINNININFESLVCNRTTHATNNSRTVKTVGFIPVCKASEVIMEDI